MNRRPSARKALDPIHVAAITVGERPTVLAATGTLRNASATGLLIRVHWRALNPALVQANGALAVPHGTLLRIHLVEMALERGWYPFIAWRCLSTTTSWLAHPPVMHSMSCFSAHTPYG